MPKELTWFETNKDLMDYLRQTYFDDTLSTRPVSFKSVDLTFDVASNNRELVDSLDLLFSVDPVQFSPVSSPSLLFTDKYNKESLVLGGVIPEVETKHVGFIDYESNQAIVFGKSFGLFKSVVVGLASFQLESQNYHPAHASLFEIAGRSIIMTGGHKAGKSTSLFHMIYLAQQQGIQDLKLLTDDWFVINSKGIARSLDDSLSITPDFFQEFPYLNPGLNVKQALSENVKKFYLDPDNVYGPKTKIFSAQPNYLVLLEPVDREELIISPNIKVVSQLLVDATNHMPDGNQDRVHQHINYWNSFLSGVKVLSFDTRHCGNVIENYESLFKTIMGEENV
jgi:hypothetical protein